MLQHKALRHAVIELVDVVRLYSGQETQAAHALPRDNVAATLRFGGAGWDALGRKPCPDLDLVAHICFWCFTAAARPP